MGTLLKPNSLQRPRTPPQELQQGEPQLLTPPLTGGFKKRMRFFDDENIQPDAKRLATTKEFDAHYYISDSEVTSSSGDASLCQVKDGAATDARSSDSSFNFMGLPVLVRKNIYTLLVTIPALVCVRQNRTSTYNDPHAYLYAEQRNLLPGIAFMLTQSVVYGTKTRLQRYTFANTSILRVSKKVNSEAKEIFYGDNVFDLSNLNKETSPPVDHKIRLFPRGRQRAIRKLTIRASSLYGFRHLLKDQGYIELKDVYRGLETLILILELARLDRGGGKLLARIEGEQWVAYVKRVHTILQMKIFDCAGISEFIPAWINLKAVFPGDHFIEELRDGRDEKEEFLNKIEKKRTQLKSAVAEAFELFKKGARQ